MTFVTLRDFLVRFADYPPERVRFRPFPGTATKADVVEVDRTEDRLCELIDGVLVEKAMGLKESFIARRLSQRLGVFVDRHGLGEVSVADGTIELFPGQVRIPDVAFFSRARFSGGAIPDDPIPNLVPDLAVEVLSRSNTKGEMFAKRKDYFFAGVRLVWYVNPAGQTVDVFTAVDAVTTLTAADTLTGGDVLPGFAAPVAELFG